MRNEVKLEYTDSAKARLEEMKQRHALELEQVIKSRKFVPGEKIVEVTVSDIERAEQHFVLVDRCRDGTRYRLLYFYAFLGGILFFAGLFYEQILGLVRDEPIRLAVSAVGVVLLVTSVLLTINLRYRQYRQWWESDMGFLEQQRRVSDLLAQKAKERGRS